MPRATRSTPATSPELIAGSRESKLTVEPPPRPVLLWIDDFEPGLAMYKTMFEHLGFAVLTASDGHSGIRLAALNRVDLVVTDYEMPDIDGEAVAAAIKSVNPQIPVILFSGSILVPEPTSRFIDAFCDKAGSRDQLLSTIQRLLQKKPSVCLQPPPVAQASDSKQRTVA